MVIDYGDYTIKRSSTRSRRSQAALLILRF